jgi:hypothetical protein
VLARRHRCAGKLSFYRCWTPGSAGPSRLIAIAVIRWRIEEGHQLAKQGAGLDAGQVTRWRSWHRWTTIGLLARHGHPTVSARPGSSAAVAGLAVPPPAPRPPSPPPLERLCQRSIVITTSHAGRWCRIGSCRCWKGCAANA